MRMLLRATQSLVWIALVAGTGINRHADLFAGDAIPPALLTDTQPLYDPADLADDQLLVPVKGYGTRPVFVAGAEATFLAPIITGSFVQSTVVNTSTLEGVEVYDDIGMGLMTYAPRVWIGVSGNDGWGLVGRFWYLNDRNAESEDITFGGDNFDLFGAEDIRLYTIDLELTKSFTWGQWLMDGSFGVRHASIDHLNGVGQNSILGSSLVAAESVADRSFNGTGITFALGGRKPFWENSALHWIWNARGSAVFGNGRFRGATSSAILGGGGGWEVEETWETNSFDDTLFIAELQAGLQWEHRLQASPATAFFRAVFEYQYWGGVNGGSVDFATDHTFSNADVANSVHVHGINLDLVGLSLGAGLLW